MSLVTLNEIAEIYNGKTPSKSEQRINGFPVLKIKDIDESGQFKGIYDSFVDNALVSKLAQKILKQSDILVLNAAHNSDYVASKNCIVRKAFEGSLATGEWMIIRVDQKKVIPEYVFFYINSSTGKLKIRNIVKGIHLYPKDVRELKIPIQPLEEQSKIVQILDQADSLRQKRKQAINLLDEYIKSAFIEMFGEKANGHKNWDSVELQKLAKEGKSSMRTGPFGSDLLHSEFVDAGIAVIGIDNAVHNKFTWEERRYITKEKYEKLKRYTLYPGDVIVTIMGTVGKSAVIPNGIPLAINTKHLAAISLDTVQANPYFISYSLHSNPEVTHQIQRQGKGAIMTGLNLGIIKELVFKLPPIELQNKFANIVQETELLKQKMSDQSIELDNQFHALMQKSFSNK